MLNLLGTFFGIGALFVPLVVAVGFGALSIAGTMALCAGVAGASTVVSATLRFPPPHEGAAFSLRGCSAWRRTAACFCSRSCCSSRRGTRRRSAAGRRPTSGEMGWSPRIATLVLLGYWVMAIAGPGAVGTRAVLGRQGAAGRDLRRAVARRLRRPARRGRVAAGARRRRLDHGSRILGNLPDRCWPSREIGTTGFAGTVFGFLFTVGNIGSITFPYALGHLSQAFGIRLGMLVPLVGIAAVIACALIVQRR